MILTPLLLTDTITDFNGPTDDVSASDGPRGNGLSLDRITDSSLFCELRPERASSYIDCFV